jgi:hypothetical protein
MDDVRDLVAASLTAADKLDIIGGRFSETAKDIREIAALAMVQLTGWQPIELAPKDATVVDIWRPSWGGERCTDMRRVDLGSGNIFYEPTKSGPSCVRDATHWRHLPIAPLV